MGQFLGADGNLPGSCFFLSGDAGIGSNGGTLNGVRGLAEIARGTKSCRYKPGGVFAYMQFPVGQDPRDGIVMGAGVTNRSITGV